MNKARLHQLKAIKYQGFTLIELLVAMLIGLTLLVGVSQIYMSQAASYRWQQEKARLQEDARLISALLNADLLPASQVSWDESRLKIVQESRPREQMQELLGTSIGEWRVQGSNNYQIKNASQPLAGLQKDDCILVSGQLYQRKDSSGKGAQQGVINLDLVSGCNGGSKLHTTFQIDGNGKVYGGGQLVEIHLEHTSSEQLLRTVQDDESVVWLDNLIAIELSALVPGSGYQLVNENFDQDWPEVSAIRLALLLRSQNSLSQASVTSHSLLSNQQYSCTEQYYCTSVIKTLRLRNHGR